MWCARCYVFCVMCYVVLCATWYVWWVMCHVVCVLMSICLGNDFLFNRIFVTWMSLMLILCDFDFFWFRFFLSMFFPCCFFNQLFLKSTVGMVISIDVDCFGRWFVRCCFFTLICFEMLFWSLMLMFFCNVGFFDIDLFWCCCF